VQLFVFCLVIVSALTHALWNFFAKKAAGDLAILWAGLLSANLALLPASVMLITRQGLAPLAWPFMIGSGIAHALYFFTLMRSYRKVDISTAYPIARGVGVGGTALLAVGLLHEVVSVKGAAGITLICIGVLLIGIRARGPGASHEGIGWPLVVGLCVVCYSLLDKVGVTHAHPVVYINFSTIVACALLSPFVLTARGERLRAVWPSGWKMSLLIGVGVPGTYLLILFAFRLAQASYVVAAREFSVVAGAVLGILFLREKLSAGKAAGIAAIVSGLVLVRLA
jgi:drug/metabolite transporter (DMT)-like permease